MIALAFLVSWAGYGSTSWGWCLVKGYDIPFGAWFSPVHPYEWPADGQPPPVPKGQVFPGGGGSAPTSTTTTSTGTKTGAGSSGSKGSGTSGDLGGIARKLWNWLI